MASKEAELSHLKKEITELEQSDPAAEHDLDATALVTPFAVECSVYSYGYFYSLRLALYKGMGFEPIMDRDGRMSKMLIRKFRDPSLFALRLKITLGAQHGDVHSMSFDGNKTYYEYAHELWKLASS